MISFMATVIIIYIIVNKFNPVCGSIQKKPRNETHTQFYKINAILTILYVLTDPTQKDLSIQASGMNCQQYKKRCK